MRKTGLIRVSSKTRRKLKRRAFELDVPMGRILDSLVDENIVFDGEKKRKNDKPIFRF